jgi:hypothetical protein
MIKINKEREFALAYRIFTTLTSNATSAVFYANQHSVSRCLIKVVIAKMNKFGCLVSRKGGRGVGGLYRKEGVSLEHLFNQFGIPYEQGAEFEKKIDDALSFYANGRRSSPREERQILDPDDESQYDQPLYDNKRLARCGHQSSTRYFRCERCLPTLEDNQTPDDWGVGLSL